MRVYKARIPYNEYFREIRIAKQDEGGWVSDTDIWRSLGYELYQALGVSVQATWQPLPVALIVGKPEAPVADFSYLNITRPLAITQRAKDALGDVLDRPGRAPGEPLGSRGELLPLRGVDGEAYWLYHDPIIDALDEANSKVSRGPRNSIAGIGLYSFIPERLEDAWLFKLPDQNTADFYITQRFKERVEAAGLTNLVLELVWDGDDPDYHDERYRTPERWAEVKQAFLASKGRAVAPLPPPPPPPTKTTEMALEGDDRESLEGMVQAAVTMLSGLPGVQARLGDDPKQLAGAVQAELERLRQTPLDTQAREHRAIELGVLYGEQLVRAYGWRWAKIGGAHAVVAPDASLYLNPVGFIFGFLLEPDKDLTVMLLFNMLAEPQPNAQAGAYQQVG